MRDESTGPFSVIVGNQTQTFNSSSGSNPPSCGKGSPLTAKDLMLKEFSVRNLVSGNDVQLVTIKNGGGNLISVT